MKLRLYILLSLATCTACFAKPVAGKQETLSETSQELFTYYFYEAQHCFDNAEYDKCIVLLDYCLTLNEQDAECHCLMGLIYGAMQATDQSLYHLQRAVELSPKEWRYRKNYASALFGSSEENNAKALEVVQAATKLAPDNEDVWETLIAIYTTRQDYKNIIRCLDKIERIVGKSPNTTFEKYKAYTMLGKEKKGVEEIEKYIADFPEEYRMQCVRGNIYLSQNEYDKAYVIYTKTLAEHPENPYIYTSLAEYYTKTGDNRKATEITIEALESKYLDMNSKLIVLKENSTILENNEIDIEPLLKNMIEQYPLEEQVHRFYAKFLHNHGRTEEEMATLQTMTDINPDNEQTWDMLVNYAIEAQNDSLVDVIINKAITHQPEKPIWYYYKSIFLIRDSAFAEAKQTSEKGLQVAGEDDLSVKLALYRQLGDINTLLNDFDAVYANYEAALTLNPKDYYVLNNFAYMLAIHGGDLKKAERMSAKTIEADPTNATYLDTYAWILYLQGSRTLAKFYIERAKEYAPAELNITEIDEHYQIIFTE